MNPMTHLHTGHIGNVEVLVRTYADDTLTIEPLDANGRGTGECELSGTGECELTAERVAS